MPKTSITYQQIAEACQALTGEGYKITLRAIVAKIGGSPNSVLQFWRQWQQEQEDITLAAIDEELSAPIKQAILAECARKVSAVKSHFAKKITESKQQWQDMQTLFSEAEQQAQQLQAEITQAQRQIIEQNARQILIDQRLADSEKHLKEIEALHQTALLS